MHDQAVPAEPDQDLHLIETLHDLLNETDLDAPRFAAEIATLEHRHGTAVYAELIFILTHLRFAPPEARDHWNAVLAHRDTMRDRLGTKVDTRVALVSYFLEVNRKLRNPKVIELKLFQQTEASAYRDELTGLCNFRHFRDHLAREIHRSERFGLPLSVIMIDIDDFKHYNDTNGHEAGNEALVALSGLLVKSLRRIDIPARYGGEEFVVILPSTSKPSALRIAERTRRRIESHSFPHAASQPGGRITVSMGIASYPADSGDASDLVRHADSALYVAKTLGKNQVHLYSQSRRSFRRIEASVAGRIALLADWTMEMQTLNLSTGGVLFRAPRQVPTGAVVQVSLEVPGAPREVTAIGRVIRADRGHDGLWETALRVLHMASEDRIHLAEFLESPALNAKKQGSAGHGTGP